MLSKKLYNLFVIAMVGFFFSAATAFAVPYELNFDPDGLVTGSGASGVYGFHAATASGTSTVIHQQLGLDGILNNGDTFYEDISLTILNGLDSNYSTILSPYYGEEGITFNVSLGGIIAGYASATDTTAANAPTGILDDSFASIFTSGLGTMKDAGYGTIMSYHLIAATPSIFSQSIFNDSNVQTNISLGFMVDSIDSDYFSTIFSPPTIQDLVGSEFLLAFAQGNVGVDNVVGDPGTPPAQDEILFTIDDNGFDIKFATVPEPTTMLLVGFGLLGLAVVSRKKVA